VRLEEQRPPDSLMWPYLVRVINGGLTLDNWLGKITTGVTPFTVPGYHQGGWVMTQNQDGMVRFTDTEAGMSVTSSPPGIVVKVFVV